MDKLYGYKEKELKEFIRYLKEKGEGKSLSKTFAEFARMKGKSKGTVRNMYYALAKRADEDEEFKKEYLGDKTLSVSKIVEFGEEEERTLIKTILLAKTQGRSARGIIQELAKNDGKKALRYQNKYRNVCANKPELIEELSREIATERGERYFSYAKPDNGARLSFSQLKKVGDEINALVERISIETKRENAALKTRLILLEEENARLKNLLYEGTNRAELFFKRGKNEKTVN